MRTERNNGRSLFDCGADRVVAGRKLEIDQDGAGRIGQLAD